MEREDWKTGQFWLGVREGGREGERERERERERETQRGERGRESFGLVGIAASGAAQRSKLLPDEWKESHTCTHTHTRAKKRNVWQDTIAAMFLVTQQILGQQITTTTELCFRGFGKSPGQTQRNSDTGFWQFYVMVRWWFPSTLSFWVCAIKSCWYWVIEYIVIHLQMELKRIACHVRVFFLAHSLCTEYKSA